MNLLISSDQESCRGLSSTLWLSFLRKREEEKRWKKSPEAIMSLGLGLQILFLWKLLGMKQSSESWSCTWALQMYCGCTRMREDLSVTLSALIPGMVMAQLDHCEDEEYPGCLPLGPSLSFSFCLETLIVPILHSGDRMSNKCRALMHFVTEVCFLSPGSGFYPALWFSQS